MAIFARARVGGCCATACNSNCSVSGPILSAGLEAGAFVNPVDRTAEPTIQAFLVPMIYVDPKSKALAPEGHGVSITTVVVKPKSRGDLRLASADPDAMPLVSPQLLADPADMATMVAGQRFFLKAFQTSPLKERVEQVHSPDPGDLSDAALAEHCRRFVKTNYHPSGTAKMGRADDPLAVLDARLRVRGVERLRVCDPLGDARHQRGQHQRAGADAGRPLRGVCERGGRGSAGVCRHARACRGHPRRDEAPV